MRRNLLVVIALAVCGALVVAGSAGARQELLGSGSSGVDVQLPEGEELPPLGPVPECANLEDDDEDGTIDLDDPGCADALDDDESDEAPGEDGDPTDEPPTDPPVDPGPKPGGDPGDGGPNDGRGHGNSDGRGGDGNDGRAGNGGRGGHDHDDSGGHGSGQSAAAPPLRHSDGSPTRNNPTVTVADFGAAPMGVPNFVIDQFTIPPFLLPIYQACGTQYGIPWEILASINRIETAFGTNLNVSYAGALGWMQFMPATWEAYGVDANGDGDKDPYNPVDAICAAARYLNASGGEEDLRTAIFAYNHADWYVDEVLLYARQYGDLPDDLVGSLTGLTEGARFPVAADARYADDISERQATKRAKPGQGAGNVSDTISSSPTRRGINIYSREDAPVIAVNDGVIEKIGHSKKLGNHIVLEDAYGNRFTYAELGSVSRVYPVPKEKRLSAGDFRLVSGGDDEEPRSPASTTSKRKATQDGRAKDRGPANTEDARERLYAFPERPENVGRASLTGQLDELLASRFPGYESFKSYMGGVLRFDSGTMEMRPLRKGSKVVAGTVLGRLGKADELAPHVNFSIRPAGRGAPKIDPKPILDGWKLLEATAIYRAAGKNPFAGSGVSIGQILLMSKEQLGRRVLANPRLELPDCDRRYVRSGVIDRRLLASLEYLATRGFRVTVTSLHCGRESSITTSGNVSHHAFASAADIAAINGQPVLGNQGRGTLTEALIQDLLQLQGTMVPDQIISLMNLGGPTFVMDDHADHVHVGYTPVHGAAASPDKQFVQLLKPEQWQRLIGRIAKIDNPKVPTKTSRYSLPSKKGPGKGKKAKRASSAHVGE